MAKPSFPVNKKSASKLQDAQENLQKRIMTHNERRMLIVEWFEWSKVALRYVAIILFALYTLKTIFCDNKIDKIINAITNIDAWQTQIIYGVVLISYFVSKIFWKK